MAASFPWQSLADQARSLEPDHRTLARETIPVAGASRLQPVSGAIPIGDLPSDLHTLIDSLRRAVRLKDRAIATEETYVYWNRRFIRFCHLKLGHASSRIRDYARASHHYVPLRLSTRQH